MGLSSDPVKRRRQLEALQRGAERRAATLRASIEAIDAEPAREAPIVAASEAEPGARIARGSYGDDPKPPPEPAPAPQPAMVDEPQADELEPEPEPEPEPDEPARGAKVAAALLGVRR